MGMMTRSGAKDLNMNENCCDDDGCSVGFLGDQFCVVMTRRDVRKWNGGKRGRVVNAGEVWV